MFNQDYAARGASATSFMHKVYAWMSAGLAVTAITAYFTAQTALATMVVTNMGLFITLVLAQFGLVIYLGSFTDRMSFGAAAFAFITYAILNGIMLSTIFLVYTQASIVATFFVTAGMFGFMALYGYFTKADLTTMGNILFMALIGLLLSMVVNIFLKSSAFDFIISIAGVVIFAGLTASDVQKIKHMGQVMLNAGQSYSTIAIRAALTLYLDFLNLFLFLLRIMGQRRKD